MRIRRELAGQKFGRLTVLYPTAQRNRNGSVYWHCQCECGNSVNVAEEKLVGGNNKSCGCLKKETQGKLADHMHWIDGTCVEILENRKHRRDNTSGFRGVHLMKMENTEYLSDLKGRCTIWVYMSVMKTQLKPD